MIPPDPIEVPVAGAIAVPVVPVVTAPFAIPPAMILAVGAAIRLTVRAVAFCVAIAAITLPVAPVVIPIAICAAILAARFGPAVFTIAICAVAFCPARNAIAIAIANLLGPPLAAVVDPVSTPVALPLCLAGGAIGLPLYPGGALVIAICGRAIGGTLSLIADLQAAHLSAILDSRSAAVSAPFGAVCSAFAPLPAIGVRTRGRAISTGTIAVG